jgi:hypothetical protein
MRAATQQPVCSGKEQTMALRPLTVAEQIAVRRMKRYQLIVLGIFLCIMILLTLLQAAGDAETGDAARLPARGVIPAGVSMHSGGWSGIPSSCTWAPLVASAALDRFDLGQPSERSADGIRYHPYVRTYGSVDQVVWTPERTPAALAQDGRLSLMRTVPMPKFDSAPPSGDVTVRAGVWFWTATPFEPQSVTAWVPGPDREVWATTTARPTGLVIDPGDGTLGTGPVVCDGPGEPWLPEHSDDWVSECTYTYRHSSVLADDGKAFRARMTIEWDVTWTSSTGAGGALTPLSSTSVTPIEVRDTTALR